ncbi:MAG: hypothetical protein GYA21_12420 [Myxococcales bacterium]|nr:hypothetical protein [Myxococcales bacterium]
MSGCLRTQDFLYAKEALDGSARSHLAGCPACQQELRRVEEIAADLEALGECCTVDHAEAERVAGAVRARARRGRGRRAVFASLSLALGSFSAAMVLWLVPAPLPAGVEEQLAGLADDVATLVTPSSASEQVPYELVATGSGFLVEDDEDDEDAAGSFPGGYGVLFELFENENGQDGSQ